VLREPLVFGPTRGEDLHAASSGLCVGRDLFEDRVDFLHRHPSCVGVGGRRRKQHEGPASFGMGNGKQHGDQGSVVEPDDDRLTRSHCVENSDGVLDLRLEVRQPVQGNRIGQACPSPVEVDQATEQAEAAQEASKVGEVPNGLDVVYPRIHEQQVRGS
jgi:hypothetical protein